MRVASFLLFISIVRSWDFPQRHSVGYFIDILFEPTAQTFDRVDFSRRVMRQALANVPKPRCLLWSPRMSTVNYPNPSLNSQHWFHTRGLLMSHVKIHVLRQLEQMRRPEMVSLLYEILSHNDCTSCQRYYSKMKEVSVHVTCGEVFFSVFHHSFRVISSYGHLFGYLKLHDACSAFSCCMVP